jgi:hypothetical protein
MRYITLVAAKKVLRSQWTYASSEANLLPRSPAQFAAPRAYVCQDVAVCRRPANCFILTRERKSNTHSCRELIATGTFEVYRADFNL